ncbi:LOW QUALITY PROTEIN: hypothetical protein ColTof4_01470 [Colletotrichum tofieldiae]|nr:LOW QUALITY PROTEIN: hypothetical protein ColTof3_08726 [Colletotrichum tofieldiae]GKT69047.1 LOW QUALITY PROTEIN: hypothetical protein ColTof4_01470 [Colletotrichum tofieldiae]
MSNKAARGGLLQGGDVLERCLDLAVELSRGRFFHLLGQFSSNEFALDVAAFSELTRLLRSNPRVSLDQVLVEYDPKSACARFKMPDTRVHSFTADRLCQAVVTAGSGLLPHLQFMREDKVKLDDGEVLIPDRANFKDRNPRVVGEIVHSFPKTKEVIEKRCAEFLVGTSGFIRAAIAIKIPYHSPYAKDASPILERLDQCLVSLWVWRQGQVHCEIRWKKVTARRARLDLKKSYFTDEDSVPLGCNTTHGQILTMIGFLRSTRSRLTARAEPSVRIPFSAIKAMVEQAVEYQNLTVQDSPSPSPM